MGFQPTDERCSEIATMCINYLLEKSSSDRGLFSMTPNMTDANWLFKGLVKGLFLLSLFSFIKLMLN